MPAPLVASAGVGGGGVEQDKKVALVVFWEGDDLFDSVNRPAKDNLLCTPGNVAFADILEANWFLTCSVVLGIRPREFVDGAKRCLVICLLLFHPLWTILMKSLSYTST